MSGLRRSWLIWLAKCHSASLDRASSSRTLTGVAPGAWGSVAGYLGGRIDERAVERADRSAPEQLHRAHHVGTQDVDGARDAGFAGGTQNAFQASLNWTPMDYFLFGLNAGHIIYDDAAIAADGDRDYSVNVAGMRAQVDF